ncbi:hypothetical protein ACERZ8_12555 [Tateyamaria armeniaca]|uniref:SPOR domain-containing protein n=1 Tax=Tateyamaria armeniaca TaxID=2518930 RepID=A0ABW8UU98_9RHOB
MKPNFALSLSFDGIRLLQRAAGGWHLLGEVSVSDPELAGALADLRKSADEIGSAPVTTKLIIPDEQVRYLTIRTPGQDDAARKKAARAALDGATPYPVDALSFDISPDGDATHIAAVARETLQEAEGFAVQHGFAPVSFVAAGEGADFLGEPFFGPTAHAAKALPPGTEVKPDGVRVVIVEKPPEADAPVDEPTEVIHTETSAVPQVDDAPPVEAEPDTPPSDEEAESPKVLAPQIAQVTAEDDEAIEAEASPESTPDAVPEPTPEAETTTPPLLGFATRRRQDPSSDAAPVRLGGVTRTAAPARTTPPLSTTPPVAMPSPPAKGADEINLATPPKSATDSLRPTPLVAARDSTPPPVAAPAPKTRTGGFLSRRKTPPKAPPPLEKPAARVAAPRVNPSQNAMESDRMTVFGARGDGTVGGKPRFLGLILMAILLVFLAGVAAWASVFLDDGLARLFPGRERTLASTLPDDTRASLAEDVGATTDLAPDPEAEADGVVVAALNDSLSDDGLSAEDAAVLDALRDPLPDPVAPEELDAAALEARYAVTGIWPKAPDLPTPADVIDIEDLYVTGIDPVSPALDAVALPASASFRTDRQLALITSPAAPGTNFKRDAQGRIIPTVAGALSPDGFTVFLGRPPVEPPAAFVRLDTGEEARPSTSALAQVRPRNRPTDLVEQNERATLGGLSRSELADLRPRLRPQAPQEIENILRDVIEENAAEETPVSTLAAASSLRPETRPRNFARTVARATPTPEPQRTAAVAPRTVTPSIPSSASVTREATVRNAINLRRVNLIGVYGTPSNRRALVRLPNGRYKKVEVGDRFDGGRVSAIGDAELRYQKGGRNVVLKMPQG